MEVSDLCKCEWSLLLVKFGLELNQTILFDLSGLKGDVSTKAVGDEDWIVYLHGN